MKRYMTLLVVCTVFLWVLPCGVFGLPPEDDNLITNGNFESGTTAGVWVPGPGCAFNDWSLWAEASTRRVLDPLIEGNFTGQIKGWGGIYQYHPYGDPGYYTVSAWAYVLEGVIQLGISDYGGYGAPNLIMGPTGKWEYVKVSKNFSGDGGPYIYAGSGDAGVYYGDFYVDCVWYNKGSESTSPFDPSTGFDPNNPNVPPVAEAGNDQVVWDSATLNATASDDPDGIIVNYVWEADLDANGTYETSVGDGATVSLTYEDLELFIGKIAEIQLTVTDDNGATDTDTMLLAVAGPCVCSPSTIHIQSIAAKVVSAGKGQSCGQVEITVFDNCARPISGAEVTGTFTGDYNEPGSGTTNSGGMAVITTNTQVKKPSYEFCVGDVSHATFTYEPNDNVERCKTY